VRVLLSTTIILARHKKGSPSRCPLRSANYTPSVIHDETISDRHIFYNNYNISSSPSHYPRIKGQNVDFRFPLRISSEKLYRLWNHPLRLAELGRVNVIERKLFMFRKILLYTSLCIRHLFNSSTYLRNLHMVVIFKDHWEY